MKKRALLPSLLVFFLPLVMGLEGQATHTFNDADPLARWVNTTASANVEVILCSLLPTINNCPFATGTSRTIREKSPSPNDYSTFTMTNVYYDFVNLSMYVRIDGGDPGSTISITDDTLGIYKVIRLSVDGGTTTWKYYPGGITIVTGGEVFNLLTFLINITNQTVQIYANNVFKTTRSFADPVGNISKIRVQGVGNGGTYLYIDNITETYTTTLNANSITPANYITINGTRYVNNLTYQGNVDCGAINDSFFITGVHNGAEIFRHGHTCYTVTAGLYNGSYQHASEGNISISFFVNNSIIIQNVTTNTFYFDLYAPVANVTYNVANEWGDTQTNLSLTCTDTAYDTLYYNFSLNSNVILSGNNTNTTLRWAYGYLVYGNNTVFAYCDDLFFRSNQTINITAYALNISIIDERNNTPFDVQNVSRIRLLNDDNSSVYDFKSAGTNSVNFTSISSAKLRLEIEYSNGDVVIRYIDTALSQTSHLRLCANTEGVTHYEQIIISAQETPVWLLSLFSTCLVAQDYTRFAYQNTLILKAYTINTRYNLYTTNEDDEYYLLAALDGSIATYVNMDTIKFNARTTSYTIGAESLQFNKTTNQRMNIYYSNTYGTSINTFLNVTRLDTDVVVFTHTETATPNNFRTQFDYSGLAGLTNQTVFRVVVTRTDAEGNTGTYTRYFDLNAKSGNLPAAVGAVISFFMFIFGLTIASTRYTLGFIGIIIILACLGVLALSTYAWYIPFLAALYGVSLIYVGTLMFRTKNYAIT